MKSKHIKMHKQEFQPIDRNVLEPFCKSLYTRYLFDHREKFHVATTHDANTEYLTWSFFHNLF